MKITKDMVKNYNNYTYETENVFENFHESLCSELCKIRNKNNMDEISFINKIYNFDGTSRIISSMICIFGSVFMLRKANTTLSFIIYNIPSFVIFIVTIVFILITIRKIYLKRLIKKYSNEIEKGA